MHHCDHGAYIFMNYIAISLTRPCGLQHPSAMLTVTKKLLMNRHYTFIQPQTNMEKYLVTANYYSIWMGEKRKHYNFQSLLISHNILKNALNKKMVDFDMIHS